MACIAETNISLMSDDTLIIAFMDIFEQHLGERHVVFHNKDLSVAFGKEMLIVIMRSVMQRKILRILWIGSRLFCRMDYQRPVIGCSVFCGNFEWEKQRKLTPSAYLAADMDLAAEQICEFAADRKAQARATVLALGGTIDLLEGLEDDTQFFLR